MSPVKVVIPASLIEGIVWAKGQGLTSDEVVIVASERNLRGLRGPIEQVWLEGAELRPDVEVIQESLRIVEGTHER